MILATVLWKFRLNSWFSWNWYDMILATVLWKFQLSWNWYDTGYCSVKISAKSGMQYFQQYFLSRDIQGLLRSVAQSKNDVGATTVMHKNFCIAEPGWTIRRLFCSFLYSLRLESVILCQFLCFFVNNLISLFKVNSLIKEQNKI